jgi:hypothetical protein
MKRRAALIIVLLVAGLVGFWAWRTFFPDPKKIIKRDLTNLATLLSFAPNEGQLAKVGNANKAAAYFTQDIEIIIDVTGFGRATLSGRDDLFQRLLGARAQLTTLKVEFLDIKVALAPNKEAAEVDMTAKANVPGDRDFQFQELKLLMKKVDGRWLIRRVETVKTFS